MLYYKSKDVVEIFKIFNIKILVLYKNIVFNCWFNLIRFVREDVTACVN